MEMNSNKKILGQFSSLLLLALIFSIFSVPAAGSGKFYLYSTISDSVLQGPSSVFPHAQARKVVGSICQHWGPCGCDGYQGGGCCAHCTCDSDEPGCYADEYRYLNTYGAAGFKDTRNSIGRGAGKEYLAACVTGRVRLYEVSLNPSDVADLNCMSDDGDCDPANCHPEDCVSEGGDGDDCCDINGNGRPVGRVYTPVPKKGTDGTHERDYYFYPSRYNPTPSEPDKPFDFYCGYTSAWNEPAETTFYVDMTGIYYYDGNSWPPYAAWNFDGTEKEWPSGLKSARDRGQGVAYDPIHNQLWAGGNDYKDESIRPVWYYDADARGWVEAFGHPQTTGGSHSDGIAILGENLLVGEMKTKNLFLYKIGADGLIHDNEQNYDSLSECSSCNTPSDMDRSCCSGSTPASSCGRPRTSGLMCPYGHYTYSSSGYMEGMGFGPYNHVFITSGSQIFEIGGGDLGDDINCGNGVWEDGTEECDSSSGHDACSDLPIPKVCDMGPDDGDDDRCVCDDKPPCGDTLWEPAKGEQCDTSAPDTDGDGISDGACVEGYTCDMKTIADGDTDDDVCVCESPGHPACKDGSYDPTTTEECDTSDPSGLGDIDCPVGYYCDMNTEGEIGAGNDDNEICMCNSLCNNGVDDAMFGEDCDASVTGVDQDQKCRDKYGSNYRCVGCECLDAIYDGYFVEVPDTKTGRLETFDVKFKDTSLYTTTVDWTFEVKSAVGSCPTVNLGPPTKVTFNVGEEKIATTLTVGTDPGGMCIVELRARDPKGGVHEDPNALYIVNDNMPICPSCDFKDVSAIIHPIGIYSGTKTESAGDLSSAQTRVAQLTAECGGTCNNEAKSKLASANGHLRTAESYNTECQKPGDNKAICRLAQYYSEVAIELVSEGMELLG